MIDYLFEALQRQYDILENYYSRTVGDRPTPQACLNCFFPEQSCICEEPNLWSIRIVMLRLRNDIRRKYPSFKQDE